LQEERRGNVGGAIFTLKELGFVLRSKRGDDLVKAQKANLQPSSSTALSRLSHSNNDNIPVVVSIRLTYAPHSLRRIGILSTRVENASYCNGDVDTNTMHYIVRKLDRDRTNPQKLTTATKS
jgi:hypothetical protein